MARMTKHYQEVQNVLRIVLVLNWAVAAAKIVFGIISRSASMTADGFHSLSDGTSNIIALVGIRLSSQPKDADHPYGHKKFETLFALGIAAMLLVVAFTFFKEGVARIFNPVIPKIDTISFIVMLVTLAVNIVVMFYERQKGNQLGSDLLVVDSMHTRTDIFTSTSVIVSLIGVKLGFPIVDPIFTIIIALVITFSAFEIIRIEAGILCDAVAIANTDKIRKVVLKIEGVMNCHKIRTRGRLDDIHLDMHVQMDGNISLRESHKINHLIQAEITKQFPHIVDIIIHMEPAIKPAIKTDKNT